MRAVLFTLMWVAVSAIRGHGSGLQVGRREWRDALQRSAAPGAQKIQIQAAQTYKAPVGQRAPVDRRSAAPAPTAAYSTCVVSRPTSQEMFQNTQTVSGERACGTGPAGGRSSLRIVGRCAGESDVAVDSEFALNSVYRGAHSLAVKGRGLNRSGRVPIPERALSTCANHPCSRPIRRWRPLRLWRPLRRWRPPRRCCVPGSESPPGGPRPREAPWPLNTACPRFYRISIRPTSSMHCQPASSYSMHSCARSTPTLRRRMCSPSA
jgi:hypothetical protein